MGIFIPSINVMKEAMQRQNARGRYFTSLDQKHLVKHVYVYEDDCSLHIVVLALFSKKSWGVLLIEQNEDPTQCRHKKLTELELASSAFIQPCTDFIIMLCIVGNSRGGSQDFLKSACHLVFLAHSRFFFSFHTKYDVLPFGILRYALHV